MLYAIFNENNRRIISIRDLNTLKPLRTLETPCKSYSCFESIRVNGKYLVLGCHTTDEFYLLKLGDSNATFDKISDTNESRFNGPNVVTIGTENNVLVADELHHRIHIYNAGTWQTLQLEPHPRNPTAAVYISDRLYVSGS